MKMENQAKVTSCSNLFISTHKEGLSKPSDVKEIT